MDQLPSLVGSVCRCVEYFLLQVIVEATAWTPYPELLTGELKTAVHIIASCRDVAVYSGTSGR